jgi:hypothetical protein
MTMFNAKRVDVATFRVAAAVGLAAAMFVVSSPAGAEGDAAAGPALVGSSSSELAAQLGHLPSRVRLVANVLITATDAAGGWSTNGRFEFVRDGERFRASARTASPSPLAADGTVAWDGLTFQYWDHARDTLHLTRGLPEVVPLSIPNPLLLPVGFLAGDLEHAPQHWLPPTGGNPESLEPTAGWKASAATQTAGREVRVVASELDPSTNRIEIREVIGGGLEASLAMVDRRRPDLVANRPALRSSTSASWSFPRTLDLTILPGADSAHGMTWRARFVITELEVGREIPAERFDLLGVPIAHVWDEEGRKLR